MRKDCAYLNVYPILNNWGYCLRLIPRKAKKRVVWCPPYGIMKFNVDGAANGKPGTAGVTSVLRNHKGDVLFMFSNNVGKKDSNEAEVLAMLEALTSFLVIFKTL